MSLLDNVTIFGKDAVASSATSFNTIDLGSASNDLSVNRHGAGYLNVHVNTNMDAIATKLALYHGDAEASVNTAVAGTEITLTSVEAGAQYSIKLPAGLKRFVTVKCDAVNTGKLDAFIGVPLAQH